MRILKAYFDSISQIIQSESNLTTNQNPSDVGTNREDIILSFLNNHLPDICKANIGGKIIDTFDNESEQVDIVVSSIFGPKFSHQNKTIYLADSTYAAIEIKSTLNYKTLEDGLNKSHSVKKLHKMKTDRAKQVISFSKNIDRICTGIFAHNTKIEDPKRILELMNKFNQSKNINDNISMIDFICVNMKYCIVRSRVEDASIASLVSIASPMDDIEYDMEEFRRKSHYDVYGESTLAYMLSSLLTYITYIGPLNYDLGVYLGMTMYRDKESGCLKWIK